MKREKREIRTAESAGEARVATSDDLAGYGFDDGEEDASETDEA
ncbi:MAG: hypothetical protein ACQGVC_15715 [Myxococcota bacterium]